MPEITRLQGCHRWVQSHRRTVDILHSPEHRSACYAGLQTCGSVWVCPVCSAKISERRRIELGAAVNAWEDQGGKVVLITYTIRHKDGDCLIDSVDGLLRARKSMRSGRQGVAFRERFGLAGSVRALEVTHGANGWHPHVHELLFVDGAADLAALEERVRSRWAEVLQHAGMRDVNEHGVKVQATYGDVAEYVAKFGHERSGDGSEWRVEHELAKTVVKSGRNGSRTPIDLLNAYVFEQDQTAGRLFQEYAHGFVGRRQLAWSPGLRSLLIPEEEELSDEALAEKIDGDYAVLLASLSIHDWRRIVGMDVRGELLDVASRGDRARLVAFLEFLGCQGPFDPAGALFAGMGAEVQIE